MLATTLGALVLCADEPCAGVLTPRWLLLAVEARSSPQGSSPASISEMLPPKSDPMSDPVPKSAYESCAILVLCRELSRQNSVSTDAPPTLILDCSDWSDAARPPMRVVFFDDVLKRLW